MSREILKNDIKLMLNKLVQLSAKNNAGDQSAVVANIFNELDNLAPIDLFVTREYLKDSLQEITASARLIERPTPKLMTQKKKNGLQSAQMKVVPDSAGNFFVVSTDGGQEKIVMQTDDKQKADEYVRSAQNAIVSAPVDEDVTDTEDLETSITDDLPEDYGDMEDMPIDEETDGEMDEELPMDGEVPENEIPMEEEMPEENAEKLEAVDSAVTKVNDLISSIDNAIDDIPDLDTITKLVTIKVSLQDKLDEIDQLEVSDPKIDSVLKKIDEILDSKEMDAIKEINATAPSLSTEVPDEDSMESELSDTPDEIEEEDTSSVTGAENFEEESDDKKDDENMTLADEDSEDAPTSKDIHEILYEDSENDEDFEGNEDFSVDDLEDTEDSEENFDETEDSVDSLLDELVQLVDTEGSDSEQVEELKEEISEKFESIESDENNLDDIELDDEEEIDDFSNDSNFEDEGIPEEDGPVDDSEPDEFDAIDEEMDEEPLTESESIVQDDLPLDMDTNTKNLTPDNPDYEPLTPEQEVTPFEKDLQEFIDASDGVATIKDYFIVPSTDGEDLPEKGKNPLASSEMEDFAITDKDDPNYISDEDYGDELRSRSIPDSPVTYDDADVCGGWDEFMNSEVDFEDEDEDNLNSLETSEQLEKEPVEARVFESEFDFDEGEGEGYTDEDFDEKGNPKILQKGYKRTGEEARKHKEHMKEWDDIRKDSSKLTKKEPVETKVFDDDETKPVTGKKNIKRQQEIIQLIKDTADAQRKSGLSVEVNKRANYIAINDADDPENGGWFFQDHEANELEDSVPQWVLDEGVSLEDYLLYSCLGW